jgi:periplasmic divalent cation tolerance protein
MSTEAKVLLTSCPDPATADRIARALVEERLAACVTRLPGARSTYRWQGKIEDAEEVLCVIKTTADRVAALLARLPALHPYEVPEALVIDVSAGLAPYLGWLASEVAR